MNPLAKMKATARKMSMTARSKVLSQKRLHSIEETLFTRGKVIEKTYALLKISLSRELVAKLKDIYALSERERSEYVGAVKFSRIDDFVKYNSPMRYTDGNPVSVTPPDYMRNNFIMYHSHPIPPQVHRSTISLPSLADFTYFVNNYPSLQANIILERNGYYLIDIIESTPTTVPDPARAYAMFLRLLELKKINDFRVPDPTGRDLYLFKVSVPTWKDVINVYIDRVMRHMFKMSVRYYRYTDLPVITLVNPDALRP